jgi:hypothetical protein
MEMADRPAPMSPPECDLRGYEYMPLFGHRLFNSDFNDMANAEEFRAAMRLWWASWQQCPAGSLPNNDAALARLADFGKDLEGWLKIKKVALHGFVECNDERLYHPLICNSAQIAFALRRRDKERKAAQRAAKKRLSDVGQSMRHPNGHPQDIQGMSLAASSGCPMGQPVGHPEDVRSDRKGKERKGKERKRLASRASARQRALLIAVTKLNRTAKPGSRASTAIGSTASPRMAWKPQAWIPPSFPRMCVLSRHGCMMVLTPTKSLTSSRKLLQGRAILGQIVSHTSTKRSVNSASMIHYSSATRAFPV